MLARDPHAGWGALQARVYDALVARGQEELYAELLAPLVARGVRGRILDVGAGPGHAALQLAGRCPDASIVGVDRAPAMVALASRRARRAGRGDLRFVVGDALDLPFAAASFDGAYSLASLKHWPDRERGLAELHRVLRPGAEALVVEADGEASPAAVAAHARRWPWIPAAVFTALFRGLVARAGLGPRAARGLARRSPFAASELVVWPELPFVGLRLIKGGA